jgi:DNA-directed RNA polymerase II subunit RPB2
LYEEEEENNPEHSPLIDQEDAWSVIRAYFKQHGLVSQQVSSFNRFLSYNVQEIVKEQKCIRIPIENQYQGRSFIDNLCYEIEF